MRDLWVDKYSPQSLADYVWQDDQTKKQVASWIERGFTDNILMYGPAGTGKSSLARCMVAELGVLPADVLKINAPRQANVDMMREGVRAFLMSGGWGGMKYVILEEFDGATHKAQESLKADMEEYSDSTRWLMTSNSLRRIIPPILDRCIKLEISRPNFDSYVERMAAVLESEGVDLSTDESMDAFDKIIEKNYPSLRGCLRDLQRYSSSGKLDVPSVASAGDANDWRIHMPDLFAGSLMDARLYLSKNVPREEMEDVFRWMYENHTVFKDPEQAILIIADGAYKHQVVSDPEINLSATITRLRMLE